VCRAGPYFRPPLDENVPVINRGRLFGGACAAMFLHGIVLAILGTLFGLPEMRARLHVDLVQQGDVFLALFVGVLASTIIAGPVIDSFGNKLVLATCATLVMLALALLAAAASFASAAAMAFVLGFGGGGLNTAANALVADLYAADRGAMLNVVGMFFGVGAVVAPLLTVAVPVTAMLLAAATLAAACAVTYLLLRFPPPSRHAGFSLLASIKAAGLPGVLLLGMVLFFESGNESSLGGWLSTYAGSMGASPRMATAILASYWAALMLGRLVAARTLRRVSKPRLVLLSGATSALGCAVLLSWRSVPVMFVGALITGLAHAAIYPTTLALAADEHPRLAGTVFGFLFAAGLVGGMVFPWSIGHLSERFGFRAAMLFPLAGAACITALRGRSFTFHFLH